MTKYAFTIKIQGVIEADGKTVVGYTVAGALLRLQMGGLRALSVGLPGIWEWDGETAGAMAEILADGGKYQCYNCGDLFDGR